MLSLQREVERIIKQADDYDYFINDEQFSATYQLMDLTLVLTKLKETVTVNFSGHSFEFKILPYNPEWYPIHVAKGDEIISIVINYENGRAYSGRNWHRFLELAKEVAGKMSGLEPEVLNLNQKPISEETVFKQMSLW
ncbi:hypothetical protein [Desulfosporosinus shakirovi]|uniref:hypothetical protein n=1 Tax=Desulfosporosinus shakirovi TaxID=2885154 RepID=UPI001E2C0580|nr:hypothetical protein [Desulfosporosinus sp. SRJS8]MCB8818670.1 hypothetical protein [Desulfosporosinus sp. SRJS8]